LKTAKLGPLSDEVRGKISEAKDRFDKGDFVNAEKLYKEVLDDAPGNAFVLSNLGVAQFRGKRYPEAEESLKKALELAPEDAFSRSTLGIVFYTQGKLDKAVDELTQSVSINPNNAVAHNYLGIAASRKGWQENARKELETAAELDPTYADAYFNLAVVCASQKPLSEGHGSWCRSRHPPRRTHPLSRFGAPAHRRAPSGGFNPSLPSAQTASPGQPKPSSPPGHLSLPTLP
jgi:Flp pilus assembly protein TadD